MVNNYRHYPLLMMVLMLVVSITCSSCEPFRKKFTRQKKRSQEVKDFQPVLEPQEYPAPEQNPPENYKQHYALVKVWYKDLWTAIEEKDSDKKAHYTLNQVLSHIQEMQKLVIPQKQLELTQLADLLKSYESSLNSPRAFRNMSRVQSDLRAFDRLLRGQLRADKLEGSFVKAAQ